ncbi:MAG: hypothetical protein HXY18_13050 [Bryobacteraceae bacterium]|nr:hypothetical protein [Bryobacteraceae bacterium]
MRASHGWFFASLLAAGCSGAPEARLVPLPPQREMAAAPDLPYERDFVFMTEARASAMIVRDIAGPGVQRWTGQNPAMRFSLSEAGEWVAEVRFNATRQTLAETGPITLAFAVNGRPIGTMRVADDAVKTFSAPVRLSTREAELSFAIDKPWTSRLDGAKLGVLLHAMGFKRAASRKQP